MSVVALAGRRIDAEDAQPPRFPAAHIGLVQDRIRDQLDASGAEALVCSAACGADLLALAVAGDLGVRRRAVLPFDEQRFRKTSVIDRPGDWGPVFDQVVADLRARGDLVILDYEPEESDAYRSANWMILDEAQRLGSAAHA
jgi:hypothetical protein